MLVNRIGAGRRGVERRGHKRKEEKRNCTGVLYNLTNVIDI
jgi:hypothetical protein